MTSPADELHTAADKIRKLAADATPGPWEGVVDHHQRGVVEASVWADSISYYVTEKISSGDRHETDAHYIAAMHPGVAAALADWLDTTAISLAASTHPDWQDTVAPDALAVARAILGGDQP